MTVEVKKFSSNKNTNHQSKQNFIKKKSADTNRKFCGSQFFSSLLQQQNSTGIVLCISSFTQPVPSSNPINRTTKIEDKPT